MAHSRDLSNLSVWHKYVNVFGSPRGRMREAKGPFGGPRLSLLPSLGRIWNHSCFEGAGNATVLRKPRPLGLRREAVLVLPSKYLLRLLTRNERM